MALGALQRPRDNVRNNQQHQQHRLPSPPTHNHRLHSMQRSQSIKICDARSHLHDESTMQNWDEDVSQMEEQYDYATLRMYYRITDYRSRSPLYAARNEEQDSIPDSSGLPLPAHSNTESQDGNEQENDTTAFLPDESDAIFEMDL
jgi:hypothetical protein